MVTDRKHFESSGKQEMIYTYDQLNRILTDQKFGSTAYQTSYSYDKNEFAHSRHG